MYGTPLFMIEKSCGISLEDAYPAVIRRKVTHAQMLAFCTQYRRMGICKLFLSGLPDAFFEDLSKSARAFLFFLEGVGDEVKLTSSSEPFFDAVACDDREAATAIARHSRQSWHQGEEYEEDFLYVFFLMSRFAQQAPRERLEAMLQRYEEALQGAGDPRLGLCRSYLTVDQKLFDDSLARIVEEREKDVHESLESERIPPDDVPTTSRLWVELLALLRFAEQAGLSPAEHHPLAPSVARMMGRARLPPPDAWRHIASYYDLR